MKRDEKFMALALEEAKKGLGRTSPNPCVGAVIVRDGRVIGRGYHKKAGTPHAERNAIASVKESLEGATMYVTLEPCSHTGKTPPCCEALVHSGFSRVVVGMKDPNPLVNGRGLTWLRNAGIVVVCGVLEDACQRLNRPFLKYLRTGLPWMLMKAGITLDGRLNYKRGEAGKITGPESLRKVHQLRNEIDGIMVGVDTVCIDNPSLTTRLDNEKSRDPVRIVLDSELRLSRQSRLLHVVSNAPTLIFCAEGIESQFSSPFPAQQSVEIIPVSKNREGLDFTEILTSLAKRGICSVMVEGGSRLHGSLLKQRFYDEACLFYSPIFAGDKGVPLVGDFFTASREFAPKLENPMLESFGKDFMVRGCISYSS